MQNITINGCTYRLNGYIDTAHETPSGAAVAYHVQMRKLFKRENYQCFPAHARGAVVAYAETLDALLSAGV